MMRCAMMAAGAVLVLMLGATTAQAQDGRRGAVTVAPTEAEMAACGQGDLVACKKGYDSWKAHSETARSRAAPAIETDYAACTGGSLSACSAFASVLKNHWGDRVERGRPVTRGQGATRPPVRGGDPNAN